jgi:hypothetical protein
MMCIVFQVKIPLIMMLVHIGASLNKLLSLTIVVLSLDSHASDMVFIN